MGIQSQSQSPSTAMALDMTGQLSAHLIVEAATARREAATARQAALANSGLPQAVEWLGVAFHCDMYARECETLAGTGYCLVLKRMLAIVN